MIKIINLGSVKLQVFYFFGAVLLSFGCAAILSLAMEFPLVNMEKHFMPRMWPAGQW